jgi:hypothetical protein
LNSNRLCPTCRKRFTWGKVSRLNKNIEYPTKINNIYNYIRTNYMNERIIVISTWDKVLDIFKNLHKKAFMIKNISGDELDKFYNKEFAIGIISNEINNYKDYFKYATKIIYISYMDYCDVKDTVIENIFNYSYKIDVEIIKYIVKDTIENNIYKILKCTN